MKTPVETLEFEISICKKTKKEIESKITSDQHDFSALEYIDKLIDNYEKAIAALKEAGIK